MIPNAKLILGPPGCGKTYRLIQEIKSALEVGTHPSRIGVISFTKKAIEEMIARSCAAVNLEVTDFPHMRTSHSFGFNGLGLQAQDVMKTSDYQVIGAELGLDFEGKDSASVDDGIMLPSIGGSGSQYLQMDTRARYRMITLDQEFNQSGNRNLYYPKLVQVSGQIDEYKSEFGKYDFVDMIEKYIEIGEAPYLDYLFIDEAQDFTPLQWEMAKKLALRAENVIIAGDDDQAIHRWTGVDVKLFIESAKEVEILNQSYRIPRSVHRLSERIVQRISGRVEKEFFPREEQGLVDYVYHLDSLPILSGSWTIMARTNSQVYGLAKWVRNAGFKYSIKGRSSLPESLVASLLTWEELCQDKKVGLQRIKDLYKLLPKQGRNASVKRGSSKLLDAQDPTSELSLNELRFSFGLMYGAETSGYDVLNVSGGERDYIDALQRRGEDLTSAPRIKLSTFHAMKGGEDDNCVVYNGSTRACVESKHPDDEHRAFYVGVTRAKERLYILQSSDSWRYTI